MSIRKGTFKLAPAEKRHRQRITLNVKLDVLQRHESGIRSVDISRAMGLPSTTVRSIIKESDKIKEFSKQDTPLNTVRLSVRNGIMVEMERLLVSWINYKTELGMRPKLFSIQEKAKSLYEELKTDYSGISNSEPFRASRGWFERFKRRANLQNITVTSTNADDMEASNSVDGMEATSTDNKEILNFPCSEIENPHMELNSNDVTLREIVEEGGYVPQQVFNVDETGLFWKRMTSTTYISQGEFSSQDNVSRDRLSLLLGSNATGDFKLKPLLVYHTETPSALKGYSKNKLSVIWRTNKVAWVTQSIFEDWFTSYFCPAVKYYCSEHNLPNKALLIIDNAPGHPTAFDDLSDKVKVIFLPANSNSLLQPMNQGIITTFKAHYHRRIFTQALKFLESDCNTRITLDEFWKNYNILKAIDNIFAAWNEITFSSINRSWQILWPDCVQEFSGFEEPTEVLYQNIVDIAKQIGLNEIEPQDIEDLIASHEEKLSTEELKELVKQRAEKEMEDNTDTEHPTKTFGLQSLGDALKHIEEAMTIFEQDDPDRQRSSMVHYAIDNAIHCYRELYREKKKATVQLSLSSFLNTAIKSEPC